MMNKDMLLGSSTKTLLERLQAKISSLEFNCTDKD